MHDKIITKLQQQLKILEQEVLIHDQQLPKYQQKLIQDVERFNHDLFVQHGAKLLPCIQQIAKNIDHLKQQLSHGSTISALNYSCERIQDRFTAVKRALLTTKINVKEAQYQKADKKAYWVNKHKQQHQNSEFSWIASSVMQNSHQLYDELNKHVNWASKIEQKIQALTLTLNHAQGKNKIELQQQVLAMHQRLGKCRQAISYIEERIQYFERPKYRS